MQHTIVFCKYCSTYDIPSRTCKVRSFFFERNIAVSGVTRSCDFWRAISRRAAPTWISVFSPKTEQMMQLDTILNMQQCINDGHVLRSVFTVSSPSTQTPLHSCISKSWNAYNSTTCKLNCTRVSDFPKRKIVVKEDKWCNLLCFTSFFGDKKHKSGKEVRTETNTNGCI